MKIISKYLTLISFQFYYRRAPIFSQKSQNTLYFLDNEGTYISFDDVKGSDDILSRDPFWRKSESTIWNVSHNSLNFVPRYIKLARTHVFLANTDASIVTKRLSDCLRKLSLHASFNDNQAMAECESKDSTKFIIQLYRGRGSYEHGVIVEVQRMFGCCIKFMKICRSLLQAAKQIEVVRNEVRTVSFSDVSIPKLETAHDSRAIEKACPTVVIMNSICRLLFESGIDSNALGLEMLRDATDSLKAGINNASKAVKIIFEGKYVKVFEYVTSLVDLKRIHDTDIRKKFCLRFLALCILSNILAVTASAGDLSQIIKKNLWFVDSFILALIEDLKNAKVCPRSALFAAKCLKHIIDSSQDAKAKAVEIDAIQVIAATNEYGKCSHALLEEETKCCAQSLRCY